MKGASISCAQKKSRQKRLLYFQTIYVEAYKPKSGKLNLSTTCSIPFGACTFSSTGTNLVVLLLIPVMIRFELLILNS